MSKKTNQFYQRALSALNNKDWDNAINSLRSYLRLDPKSITGYFNLAYALNKKGDLQGALKAHYEAIILQPFSAEAYYLLGNTLLDNADYSEAGQAYRNAIKVNAKM